MNFSVFNDAFSSSEKTESFSTGIKEQCFWKDTEDSSQVRTIPAFASKEGTHKTSTGIFEVPAKTKA
jgi:hypothetical protein